MRSGWAIIATTLLASISLLPGACSIQKAEPPQYAITGTVAYPTRIALPRDAAVHLTLEDVSRSDGPATVIAIQMVPTRGRQVPIPFDLLYNPQRVDPSNRYAVRAEIYSGRGELLFATASSTPVLTYGAPSNVDLSLQSVGAAR